METQVLGHTSLELLDHDWNAFCWNLFVECRSERDIPDEGPAKRRNGSGDPRLAPECRLVGQRVVRRPALRRQHVAGVVGPRHVQDVPVQRAPPRRRSHREYRQRCPHAQQEPLQLHPGPDYHGN